MNKFVLLLMISSLTILTSCGGGGTTGTINTGGTSATTTFLPSLTTRLMTTDVLRIYNNGDSIQYTVLGSSSQGGASTEITGTYSVSVTLLSSPPSPAGVPRSVWSASLRGTAVNGASFDSSEFLYFHQEPAPIVPTPTPANGNGVGTFYFDGDTAGWFTPTSTITSLFISDIKSPIVRNSSWINSYSQNGDSTTEQVTVVGKATVATGMGVFEAYELRYTGKTVHLTPAAGTPAETLTSKTKYVVPSIGVIKDIISTTTIDSARIILSSTQFTRTALTTNIPF